MTDKDLRGLSRSELVDVIHALVENESPDAETVPTADQVEAEQKALQKKTYIKRRILSIASVLIVAAAIAALISTLFLPVIQISGDNMEPTFHNGDVVLLCKIGSFDRGSLCCISWQNKLIVKRVIAVAGDSVSINDDGDVYVNNVLVEEPYAVNKCLGECDIEFPCLVPENQLFILGDRRDSSVDSRSTLIGCVDSEQVTGRVVGRIWPIV